MEKKGFTEEKSADEEITLGQIFTWKFRLLLIAVAAGTTVISLLLAYHFSPPRAMPF